jgi:RNA polymerase sigma factor (TIGR02999 family)
LAVRVVRQFTPFGSRVVRQFALFRSCASPAPRAYSTGDRMPNLPSPPLPFPSNDDDALYALVYVELKRIAHHHLRTVEANATLSTTELVHEAFLKLGGVDAAWEGRSHFFGAASRAMREVLVDFARRRRAAKRGADASHVSLTSGEALIEVELDELVELDEALDRLNAVDERLRQIVELRFFGGFTEREVADLLGVTTRTVERNWIKARLFLLKELEQGGRP